MENSFNIPFYARTAMIFIVVSILGLALYLGQEIIVPLLYAGMIAILLNPLVNFLIRKGVNKMLAIAMAVTLAIFALLIAVYIVSAQITLFTDTYPQLKEKFATTSEQLLQWASHKFNIRQSAINAWLTATQHEAIGNFDIAEKLSDIARMLVIGTLLPVYLFMILHYKPLLLEFIGKLFKDEHRTTVQQVLSSSKNIIQSYLVGLFFELIIVAVLNSLGLLLLGIEYAIILGITGAILNIIPYLGGIAAIMLPMLIAYITKDSLVYPFLVFVVYIVVQFIDNNYIVPRIVGARVQLNALISVIVVLIGGAFWGIPGMFLSIPLTAIAKIIFDHIDSLKPWGFLLGNVVSTTPKFSLIETIKIKTSRIKAQRQTNRVA
jgi:predicted PurR-regulated permease PerM